MPLIKSPNLIYAVGDIHGRADLLKKLHQLIARDVKKYPRAKRTIIYLGDYIDRGPDSKSVINTLLHPELDNFKCIFLKGNHESLFLEFLKNSGLSDVWLLNGGLETLRSYGVNISQGNLLEQCQKKMPTQHLKFLKSLKTSYLEGDYFFCHAGINPANPLNKQKEEDLLWIREPFLSSKKKFEKIIVHGHSIVEKPTAQGNRICVDTGAIFSNVLTCLVLKNQERYFLHT